MACVDGACNVAKFEKGAGEAALVKENSVCGRGAIMGTRLSMMKAGLEPSLQACADICQSVNYCNFFAYEHSDNKADDSKPWQGRCWLQTVESVSACEDKWERQSMTNFYTTKRAGWSAPPPPPWLTQIEASLGAPDAVASRHPVAAAALLGAGILIGLGIFITCCCVLKWSYDRSELGKRRRATALAEVEAMSSVAMRSSQDN